MPHPTVILANFGSMECNVMYVCMFIKIDNAFTTGHQMLWSHLDLKPVWNEADIILNNVNRNYN
jgi:hypothetical protein